MMIWAATMLGNLKAIRADIVPSCTKRSALQIRNPCGGSRCVTLRAAFIASCGKCPDHHDPWVVGRSLIAVCYDDAIDDAGCRH